MLKSTFNTTYLTGISNLAGNLAVLIIAFLLLAPLFVRAQSTLQPKRGLYSGGSYAASNMETVNMQGGGLMLNFPLASLPQGRGESGGAISLSYNSKIWDPQHFRLDDGCGDPHCNTRKYKNLVFVYPSQSGGGWNYALFYKLEQFNQDTEDRSGARADRCVNGENTSSAPSPDPYLIRQRMRMPDGSTVDFREQNENAFAGYFRRDMAGRYYYCVPPNGLALGYLAVTAPTYQPKTYFSTDGSRLRLDISYTVPNEYNQRTLIWKLYYPDGSRVEGTSQDGFENITNTSLPYSIRNERYDRNGNRIVTEKTDTVVKISDSTGREIKIDNFGLTDEQIISTGVGGETVEWQVKWKQISIDVSRIRPSGDYWGGQMTGSHSMRVVDQIISPTQMGSQVYTFEYNHNLTGIAQGTGEISAVNFPTGARSEYSYDTNGQTNLTTGIMLGNYLTRKKLIYQTEADGASQTVTEVWNYSRQRIFDFQTGMPKITSESTVINPDGGQTTETYNISESSAWSGRLLTRTTPDGTTTENVWTAEPTIAVSYPYSTNYNPYLKAELTWIKDAAGNLSKAAIKDYSLDQNGNVTQIKEYDWVPAGSITRNQAGYPQVPENVLPIRVTNNTYAYATADASNNNISSPYIYWKNTSLTLKNAVASTEITDGSGNVKSRTEFTYDDASTTGNVILVKVWDSWKNGSYQPYSNPLTSANSISNSTTYNQYGSPITVIDANGNQTQITYGAINGPNNTTVIDLYPTQVITAYGTAVRRTASSEYDFYTGLVTKITDVDNDVSSAAVYDALGRTVISKTAVNTPLEAWKQIEYNDQLRRIITRSDQETKGDGKRVSVQHFDQLGRVRLSRTIENIAIEDPTNEQHGIKISTRYKYDNPSDPNNSNGFYNLVSNPYRAATSALATNEETMGWSVNYTTKTGTRLETKTFSGASLPAPWGNNTNSTGVVSTDIDADRILVTDQAGRQRVSKINALGQFINVWEVKEQDADTEAITFGSPAVSLNGLKTAYSYDTLDNLTAMNQGAQQRIFSYSSISRLRYAQNPESGTINYEYDANGNLKKKTDARNIETNYTYDALNRMILRDYSDSTPDVTYTYDGAANAKGKLTKVSSTVSTTEYTSFDKMSRVLAHKQTTDGNDYTTAYSYNLSGALIEETYPSTRKVKNVLDSDGDLSAVQSRKNSNAGYWNYAQHFSYTVMGVVSSVQLGNGRWESTQFNSRLQTTQIALGSAQNQTDWLKLNYDYGTTANNGNLLTQTVTVPTSINNNGFTAVQNYSYDSLNRLKQANEKRLGYTQSDCDQNPDKCWQQTFTYDRYGNRNFQEAATTTLPKNCNNNTEVCQADRKIVNPSFNTSNNQLQTNDGYNFDQAGNTTKDAQGRTFVYDAENRQITARDSLNNLIGLYSYDGSGRRVKKHVPATGETTVFVYNTGGKLVAEYSTIVAPPSEAKVSYLTSDYLETPRIITDANGYVISRRDFHPFGEVVPRVNYGTDEVRNKFTGYERDAETELDFAQARFYSNKLGRFYSVDPENEGAYTENPQSWNAYTYSLNNPLKCSDPTGRAPECTIDGRPMGCDEFLERLRKGNFETASGNVNGFVFYIDKSRFYADVIEETSGAQSEDAPVRVATVFNSSGFEKMINTIFAGLRYVKFLDENNQIIGPPVFGGGAAENYEGGGAGGGWTPGPKVYLEKKLSGSGKHGLNWQEATSRARKENKPQGKFGSKKDLDYVLQKAQEIGPGNSDTVEFPDNDSVVYMPDGRALKPSKVFIKVNSNGKVHAYPKL